MPDTVGSLIRRAAIAACLFLTVVACAAAQTPLPSPTEAPAGPDFLARTNSHFSLSALSIEDERFSWDAHFGADFDAVDYVVGRVNLLADYEAVLGSEFRPFDPNQGNYTLEASSSARVGGTEIAGVFHHLSRHLSDRPKRSSIAFNTLGVRVLRRVEVSGTTFDVQGGVGKIVQHSFVDYGWTANADLVVRRPVNARVAVYAHGTGELIGIDPELSGRGTQQGGRIEGGLRILGGGAALELFAGYEQRIDAYQLDREALSWGFAGFRLTNR